MLKKSFLLANIVLMLVSCQYNRSLTQADADSLLATGELLAAQRAYESLAAQEQPPERKAALWFRAAEVAAGLTSFDQALIDYQKTIRLVPFTELAEEASSRRAQLYSELNNIEAELAEYSQLVKHYPKSQQIYMYRLRLAEGHLILGRFVDALREMENLYQDQKLPEAMKETVFFNAAELYFLDGKFQQAMSAYSAFLQTFPKSQFAGEAHLKLASVLERMGQLNMAYQAAKPAETLYPNKEVVEMRIKNLSQNMTRQSEIPPPAAKAKKTK